MNEFEQMQEGAEGIELTDEEGAGSARPGGASNLIFAGIVVVLLAFQAVSANFIVRNFLLDAPLDRPKPVARSNEQFGLIHQLTGIIVNPADAKGNRHLLVDIGFETTDPKVIAELTEREPLLRDNIITFLSAQRYEVLTDITMREKIRQRVIEIANYNLTKGTVDRVYFIRYVVQ